MKRDRITEIELSQRDFNSRNARVSRGLYSVYILWRGDETPCALVAPAGSKIMRATCKPEITVIERSRGAASRVSVPATLGDIRGTFSLSLSVFLFSCLPHSLWSSYSADAHSPLDSMEYVVPVYYIHESLLLLQLYNTHLLLIGLVRYCLRPDYTQRGNGNGPPVCSTIIISGV